MMKKEMMPLKPLIEHEDDLNIVHEPERMIAGGPTWGLGYPSLLSTMFPHVDI